MTTKKGYNVLQVVCYYILFVTSMGCSNLPNRLGMDRDHSLESLNQGGSPVVLLPSNTQAQELDYTPNGIIMGNIGSGKTTLLNMLSNTVHATSGGFEDSVTREIFKEPVAYGDYSFRLVDTPGLNGEEEAYKHSFLLKSAYEAMPYTSIFVVVQFNTRGTLVKKEFLDVTRYVKKYKNNLVLMLSCCDLVQSQDRERVKRNVASLADRIGIRHTIMYSKRSNPTDLANAMYACTSNNPRININVTDEEFFLKFKLWDTSDLSQAYDEFKEKSENLLKE